MHLTFRHLLLGLFAVANNFPAIGPFLALCNGLKKEEEIRLAFIATLSAFITMLLAMFAGQMILEFFGIGIEAFRATGGIILCLSGAKMLSSDADGTITNKIVTSFEQKIPAVIVPIAIPLTTGAGTIATITIFAGELKSTGTPIWTLLAAVIVMAIIIYLLFRYSTKILYFLGPIGMNVLTKITGLITMAIGTQFIFNALITFFPGLK